MKKRFTSDYIYYFPLHHIITLYSHSIKINIQICIIWNLIKNYYFFRFSPYVFLFFSLITDPQLFQSIRTKKYKFLTVFVIYYYFQEYIKSIDFLCFAGEKKDFILRLVRSWKRKTALCCLRQRAGTQKMRKRITESCFIQ